MRTHSPPRRVMTTAALLAAAGLALTACSDGQGQEQMTPTPSPSTSAEVSDGELGLALDALVAPGTPSSDNGACLVTAVRSAGLDKEALAHVVERGGDDFAAMASSLRSEVSGAAAEALLAPTLREELDACVDAGVAGGQNDQKIADIEYEPAPAPEPEGEGEPVTEPKYPVPKDEDIRSPQALVEGVVSMFISYADTEEEKQAYTDAGQCLAEVIYAQDFSQQSLRFIAGGAPLGSGSLLEHLSTKKDKKIWSSSTFTTSMVDCVEAGSSEEDEAAVAGG